MSTRTLAKRVWDRLVGRPGNILVCSSGTKREKVKFPDLCKLYGHEWSQEQFQPKRTCERCGQEQWLMYEPFPQIGEPQKFWKDAPEDLL